MEVLKLIKQEIGYQHGKLIEFSNCKRANETAKASGQMNKEHNKLLSTLHLPLAPSSSAYPAISCE